MGALDEGAELGYSIHAPTVLRHHDDFQTAIVTHSSVLLLDSRT